MDRIVETILKPKGKLNGNISSLTNVDWSYDIIQSHTDVFTKLKDKNPYTVTILIESLKYEYRNRKEYVKKTKIPIESKYRELLYEYFFNEFGQHEGNRLYGTWLDKYRPQHNKEKKYPYVDEYIILHELEPRYKARILNRYNNHDKLFRQRIRIDRDRYYRLPKPLDFVDWRNPYDTLFIWHENGKKIARRGGSGSSGARETNSIFIFGLLKLNKVKKVPSYLFIYTSENTLFYIKKFSNLCIPDYDIGSNYFLEHEKERELQRFGMFLRWEDFYEIKKIEVIKTR